MRNRCGDIDVVAGRQAPGCHPKAQGQGQGEGKQKHRNEMAHARVPANSEISSEERAQRPDSKNADDLTYWPFSPSLYRAKSAHDPDRDWDERDDCPQSGRAGGQAND